MFVLGGFFAMMMRLELLTPEGDLLTSDTYNKFFTLHGILLQGFRGKEAPEQPEALLQHLKTTLVDTLLR